MRIGASLPCYGFAFMQSCQLIATILVFVFASMGVKSVWRAACSSNMIRQLCSTVSKWCSSSCLDACTVSLFRFAQLTVQLRTRSTWSGLGHFISLLASAGEKLMGGTVVHSCSTSACNHERRYPLKLGQSF